MPPQKLIDYIKSCQEDGILDEQIKSNLQDAGWKKKDIKEAFKSINSKGKEPSEVKLESNNIKKFILPAAIAAGLLLVGGIIYGFFISGPTPREEIMQGYKNLMSLDSVTIQNNVTIAAESKENGQSMDMEASLIHKISDVKDQMEITLEGEGMVNGTGGSLKGKVFVVNDKLFGKISEFPSVVTMFLPIEAKTIKGKNILLTEDLSKKIENTDVEKQVSKTPFQEELSKELNVDIDKKTAKNMTNDFVKGVWDRKIVSIQKTTEVQLKGKKVNKHTVKLNLDKLPQLIFDIAEKYEGKIENFSAEKVKSDFEENREDFNKLKEDLKEIDLGIFIWTDSQYIHKIEIAIKDAAKQSPKLSKFQINTSVEFSEFNQPLNIQEPNEYTHIDKLMEELMGSYSETLQKTDSSGFGGPASGENLDPYGLNSAQESAYDTQIMSDLSQIRSTAEQYYYGEGDGSYSGFKSSDDWNQISGEIPDCAGQNSYQINISNQEYVSWAPLCGEEGFYCVDSEGNSGEYQGKINEGYSCFSFFESSVN